MCGARGAPRPWMIASGTRASSAASSRSRSAPRRRPLLLTLGDRELGGAGETDRHRDVLRARATSAILRAAEHQRLHRRAAADVQRADSLRRADLVSRDRQQVERRAARVDLHLAERLHGVAVEDDARALRARARAPESSWMVPISLFTHITEQTAASSRTQRVERRGGRRRPVCVASASSRSSPPSLRDLVHARRAPPCARSASTRRPGGPRRAARARRRGAPCCPPRCRTR